MNSYAIDSSPMVSLSYREYDPKLGAYYWITGEQHKESRVRSVANMLTERGCLAVHWETM